MLDVFSEEIELLIKSGLANLYWYKDDLKTAWFKSGISSEVSEDFFSKTNGEGRALTKKQLMDLLYIELRNKDYNRRLEISRNFVRILVRIQVIQKSLQSFPHKGFRGLDRKIDYQ